MKIDLKRYLVFIIGLIFFGFGISLGNKSLLGGNAMSIFVVGISKHIILTIGQCNFIVGLVESIIGYIFDKKNVTLATIISMVFGSSTIDFANMLIKDTSTLSIRVIYMLIGIVMYCGGLAIQQFAKCGYGSLDCLNFGLKKFFKVKDYHTIRWFTDIFFIVFGTILGGIFNVGTVLLLAFAGLLIERIRSLLIKAFKNTSLKYE